MEQMEMSIKIEVEAVATSAVHCDSEIDLNSFMQDSGLLQSMKNKQAFTKDTLLKEEILVDSSQDGSEQQCVNVVPTLAHTGYVNETCSTSLSDLLNVKYESAELEIGPIVLQDMDTHYTINKNLSAGVEENTVGVDGNEAMPGSGVKKENIEDGSEQQCVYATSTSARTAGMNEICSTSLGDLLNVKYELAEMDIAPTVLQHMDSHYTFNKNMSSAAEIYTVVVGCNGAIPGSRVKKENIKGEGRDSLTPRKATTKEQSSLLQSLQRTVHQNHLASVCTVHLMRLDVFQCDLCYAVYTEKDRLLQHLQAGHACRPQNSSIVKFHKTNKQTALDNKATSHNCNQTTTVMDYDEAHVNSHYICDASFVNSNNLRTHARVHTGEKPYQCKLCEARFTDNSNLTRHMRIHTGEKPYRCKICKARFAQNSVLTQHVKIHSGEKPYQCKICKGRFTQRSSLTKHTRVHTGEKPYQCKICKGKFTQSDALTKHMRVHTGEKPYQCKLCEARFTDNSNLTRHMRIHTGEKPYQCKICNTRFTGSGDLNKHARVHTGEKRYQCKVCEARFAQISSLTRHMIVHTGEKPYQCKICDSRFALSINLTRHMRVHKGE